ncbi:HU family DNA-binding protein [Candidatus Uhrbacteria bacterium]|nr:HU family DNA-binding protein [Candidatus Uhrbacteria bacterium]
MNKAELINHLSDKCGLTKKQAEDVVEAFVEVVTSTLKSGGEVNIAGFGAFMAKTRAARMGVNPQAPTEKIQIPAVIVPKFKAGKGLKDALKAPKMTASAPVEPPAPAPAPTPAPTVPPTSPSPTM